MSPHIVSCKRHQEHTVPDYIETYPNSNVEHVLDLILNIVHQNVFVSEVSKVDKVLPMALYIKWRPLVERGITQMRIPQSSLYCITEYAGGSAVHRIRRRAFWYELLDCEWFFTKTTYANLGVSIHPSTSGLQIQRELAIASAVCLMVDVARQKTIKRDFDASL